MPLDLAEHIRRNVQTALDEDIGGGDLTAQLIPEHTPGRATVITRQAMVLCGTLWFEGCFRVLDANCEIHWQLREGGLADAG